MKTVVRLLSICSILLLASTPALAVKADDVLSALIKEADGISGQDTNSGSGVKTGHIQDAAITEAKLANAAVTAAKISDGAITPAKLSGPITQANIDSAGLNADTLDNLHAADLALADHNHADLAPADHSHADLALAVHEHTDLYQGKVANRIVVAQSGSDFTSPLDAIASISNASAANPYLVKIMPGNYDLGGVSLAVPSYVQVEGSGQVVTTLIGNVRLAMDSGLSRLAVSNFDDGTVYGNVEGVTVQGNTRISDLLVTVGGALGHNLAISVRSGAADIRDTETNVVCDSGIGGQKSWGYYFSGSSASGRISDSRTTVSDCAENHGVGVTFGSSAVLDNITVDVINEIPTYGSVGVRNSATMVLKDSIINGGKYGIINGGSPAQAKVFNTTVTATDIALHNYTSSELLVMNSQIQGGLSDDGTSTLKLSNVVNENLDPLSY